MIEFKNVTVAQAANFYFDGKVTSRTLTFEDGTTKTLGIMMPGEYEFGAADAEIMEITSGELDVKLPGSDTFIPIKVERSLMFLPTQSFKLRSKRSRTIAVHTLKSHRWILKHQSHKQEAWT